MTQIRSAIEATRDFCKHICRGELTNKELNVTIVASAALLLVGIAMLAYFVYVAGVAATGGKVISFSFTILTAIPTMFLGVFSVLTGAEFFGHSLHKRIKNLQHNKIVRASQQKSSAHYRRL